jgi:hypothetical protein
VAFIALTDSSFRKEELMRNFFSEDSSHRYNLYIHNKNEIKSDFFKKFAIPDDYKVNTEWGKYSLILATIRSLMFALKDPANKKFVLISESHIPLYEMNQICDLIFERYPVTSFSWSPREEKWSIPRFKVMVKNPSRNPFDINHVKFVAQWFVCNREDAEIFCKNEIKLRKYFDTDKLYMPDEIYFHLIARYFNLNIQYKNSCHVNWNLQSHKSLVNTGHRSKPKTYSKISNKFISILRQKSDCIFLRKVYDDTIIDEDFLLKYHDR